MREIIYGFFFLISALYFYSRISVSHSFSLSFSSFPALLPPLFSVFFLFFFFGPHFFPSNVFFSSSQVSDTDSKLHFDIKKEKFDRLVQRRNTTKK